MQKSGILKAAKVANQKQEQISAVDADRRDRVLLQLYAARISGTFIGTDVEATFRRCLAEAEQALKVWEARDGRRR